MTMLLENPLPTFLTGAVIAAILAVWFFQTGRGMAIVALLGVIVATGCLLLVERLVVTEREKVEDTLYALADALVGNDVPATLEFLSTSSPHLRSRAEHYLGELRVQEAKIGSDLKITINELTSPPSAKARFTGRLTVDLRRGNLVHNVAVRKFTLSLVRENGKWKVADYEEENLTP